MSKRRSNHIKGVRFESGLEILFNSKTRRMHCAVNWTTSERQEVARYMFEDDMFGLHVGRTTLKEEAITWRNEGPVVAHFEY